MKMQPFIFSMALSLTFVFLFPSETISATYSDTTLKDASPAVLTASEKKLLDATVNIYCTIKSGNKTLSTTGSGVFIDSRGIILTNAHVAQYFLLKGTKSRLQSNCSIRTGSPAKARYEAEILYISPEWITENVAEFSRKRPKGTGEEDYALLYITGTSKKKDTIPARFPTVPISRAVLFEEDAEVRVAGYPAGDLKFRDIKTKLSSRTTSSTIASVNGFTFGNADMVTLAPSMIAQSGVSGGPITDDEGNLIALAATMSTGKKKEGSSLRGITLSYIDRAVRTETALPLQDLYIGDLSMRSRLTYEQFGSNLLKIIEKGIRNIR